MSTSTENSVAVGGLAGSNSGVIASCYHAGKVSGKSGTTTGGITASNSGTLDNNYYNSTLLTPTYTPDVPEGASSNGVIPKSSSDMTKQTFVYGEGGTETLPKIGGLNYGIKQWRTNHSDKIYDSNYEHHYVYQPANYPKLN